MSLNPNVIDSSSVSAEIDERIKSDPNWILKNTAEIMKATGLRPWYIGAMKRYIRRQKLTDSPFSGRLTTRRKLERWIFNHPEFNARSVHGEPNTQVHPHTPADRALSA